VECWYVVFYHHAFYTYYYLFLVTHLIIAAGNWPHCKNF